jgi:hypothetical protein
MKMNDNVMSKQVFDGEKGTQSGMGMPISPIEGEDLTDLREQAAFCKEANYKNGYKLTLKGIEEINNSPAYIVEVERPDGSKSTDYYDMKSSLKIREVSTGTGADGQPSVQTTDYADYNAIDGGLLLPHTLTVAGVFPVPFKVMLNSVKVNAGVDDAVFKQ